MTSNWRGGVAPHNPLQLLHHASLDDGRRPETQLPLPTSPSSFRRGEFAVPAAPVSAQLARPSSTMASPSAAPNNINNISKTMRPPPQQYNTQQTPTAHDSADSSSQSLPRSTLNSQESVLTEMTDPVVTPPASQTSDPLASNGLNGVADLNGRSGHANQLLHLSSIAAAQDKMVDASSRKRMADGEVKIRPRSMSPVKGHYRTTSAISMASNGSHIGELSAELRTRLSYAMVKVNHGWQGRSLDEVESLASQAVSPTSSTSTLHRRQGSSASPSLPIAASVAAQVHFAHDPVTNRRKSKSPPRVAGGPTLAPPASIQPSSAMAAPGSNRRRNSNPRYTPAMLSHFHPSASPQAALGDPMRLDTNQLRPQRDPILYSPHQNVREQDAIETLLFMSSPGNSANLKHAFSPSGSPGPQNNTARGSSGRHALPGAPRKTLPSQRPAHPNKKAGFDRSPGMPPPPGSPMELDSPQQLYHTPNRGTPRRRMTVGASHIRGALSLPSGLGVGNGVARKTLRDEDIERMLDRAGAETADSSDDEEIQLPRGRSGVAGVLGI